MNRPHWIVAGLVALGIAVAGQSARGDWWGQGSGQQVNASITPAAPSAAVPVTHVTQPKNDNSSAGGGGAAGDDSQEDPIQPRPATPKHGDGSWMLF